MQNKGVIYATDIHEHKIKLIEENSRRLGITIIEPSLQDAAEFKPEWASMADCVLVDAPCSGWAYCAVVPKHAGRKISLI